MSNVDAAELVLRSSNKAMHARDIARAIIDGNLAKLSGKTPWKTITARISMDILNSGEQSKFQRAGHAIFMLREWNAGKDFAVKRRKINPIDETIKAVPIDTFLSMLPKDGSDGLYTHNFQSLLDFAVDVPRAEAETSLNYVQLIPTFIVRKGSHILTYKRTKRLPESRLHHSWCVSFGGHMQSDDTAGLFNDQPLDNGNFVLRELYEELSFSENVKINYVGILYLQSNDFEKQHAGLVFDVAVPTEALINSLEPGMHTDVQLTPISQLLENINALDSWSRRLVRVTNGIV